MEFCAECGMSADSQSCDELFDILLGLDHSREEPWGPLHGASVACYLFQHPSRLPADGGVTAWAMMQGYLEGGLEAMNRIVGQARRGNSHRVNNGPVRAVPGMEPPKRDTPPIHFDVTISDIAVDGTFPADGFADRVKTWAAATVGAWNSGT